MMEDNRNEDIKCAACQMACATHMLTTVMKVVDVIGEAKFFESIRKAFDSVPPMGQEEETTDQDCAKFFMLLGAVNAFKKHVNSEEEDNDSIPDRI
jgi:hypothetical protein